MSYYHGTDAKAAESILRTGLRQGAFLTDDLQAAQEYAVTSAHAAQQDRAAVLAVANQAPAGALVRRLEHGHIGPCWRNIDTVPMVLVERLDVPPPTEHQRAYAAARARGRAAPAPMMVDPGKRGALQPDRREFS